MAERFSVVWVANGVRGPLQYQPGVSACQNDRITTSEGGEHHRAGPVPLAQAAEKEIARSTPPLRSSGPSTLGRMANVRSTTFVRNANASSKVARGSSRCAASMDIKTIAPGEQFLADGGK
jgi:hypothetical protein